MLIQLERDNDVCILRLNGRFAPGVDAAYLRTKAEEIKSTGLRKMLVDFTAVPYLDSIGIGFLIGIYTSMLKSQEGSFAIIRANDRVKEVIGLTKLTGIFPAYKDEPAALKALRESAGAAETAGQA
jgi:anti-anti-sigma factor